MPPMPTWKSPGNFGIPSGSTRTEGSIPGKTSVSSWKILRLSVSLCTTLQPSHRANTDPFSQACGLIGFTEVSPQRLQVNWTCAHTQVISPLFSLCQNSWLHARLIFSTGPICHGLIQSWRKVVHFSGLSKCLQGSGTSTLNKSLQSIQEHT